MKKVYIQPQMAVDQLETEMLIAQSLLYNPEEAIEDNDDIGTKEQNDWNIWDN